MTKRSVSLLCLFLVGGLLTACSAADSSDSGAVSGEVAAGSGGSAGNSAVKPEDVAKAAGAGDDSDTGPAAVGTRLVRTAEISVEVKNVGAAARSVRTTAIALGGVVSTENTTFPAEDAADETGQRSEITLRVPEPAMDDALAKIAGVGREVNRSTTSEDVTATIVDLDSRVATQTRSVARVRELLDDASSLQDVVTLESELAQRESELESIQARQRALKDKAALATVNVSLHAPGEAAPKPAEAGFRSGLDDGWSALKASTTVVLTVLGALLPIAVVIAVIGVPVYFLRRKLFPRKATASPAGAGPPPDLAATPTP